MGMIIRSSTSRLWQPSMIADSMISQCMVLKKETIRYTLNGAVMPE